MNTKTRSHFAKQKQQALQKLQQAKDNNKVDTQILPLLTIINNSSYYYTSSSCSGRIVLLQLPEIGDKQHAQFLGKWHHPITLQDLKEAAAQQNQTNPQLLWLLAQSPILHIVADTLDHGDLLVKTAISCGFKNSGFRSISKKIIIEIASTERLDTPLAEKSTIMCSDEYLCLIIRSANTVISRSNEKLSRFHQKFTKN